MDSSDEVYHYEIWCFYCRKNIKALITEENYQDIDGFYCVHKVQYGRCIVMTKKSKEILKILKKMKCKHCRISVDFVDINRFRRFREFCENSIFYSRLYGYLYP